jgi:hypothetical protein
MLQVLARNLTLKQQLDDTNNKILEQFNVQNAYILKFQNQFKLPKILTVTTLYKLI